MLLTYSSWDMPAADALRLYRGKDAMEKLFHSLKSEVEVRPARVWTQGVVYGPLLLGFIAQLMIPLTRWFVEPFKAVSTKFIASSLQNLTLTVVSMADGQEWWLYVNFDSLNRAILVGFMG